MEDLHLADTLITIENFLDGSAPEKCFVELDKKRKFGFITLLIWVNVLVLLLS